MRNKTRVRQIIDPLHQQSKQEHCRRVMTTFYNRIRNPKLLKNMDQTPVYMNCTRGRTVH